MHKFSFASIKILVTSYCNLCCKHCYQHFEKNKFQLPAKSILEIIDFAHRNDTKIIDFGGGEFFTHPYAYDLLDYCFSKGIHVNIATNATSVSREYFASLRHLDLVSIQISVDGLKENHESRRGSGTYHQMINNAKFLYELGLPLTASMALDEKNYTDAIDVLQMPYFSNVIFLPVALTGAAKNNASSNAAKTAEYEKTMCFVMEGTECGDGDFQNNVFPSVLTIKYNGNVYPAQVASDYDLLRMGNVYEQPIEIIAENFLESESYHKLRSIRNSEIVECNTCASSDRCNRGCRFRAMKFHGEMLRPDPFYCRIFENTYYDIPLGKLFWGEKST